MEFRVSLFQMPCKDGDRNQNFDYVRQMLTIYEPSDVLDLILLPELFSIGFDSSQYSRRGAGVMGKTSEFIERVALEQSAYVAGTGIENADEEGKYFNTLVLASPDGKTIGTYRKIHPFQAEKDVFEGGNHMVMFDLRGLKIGAQICYDVRFPEISRRLALEGAELLIIPAAFPDPRSEHWDNLVRARAIENQLYVAAVNRVGPSFDKKTYFGHSQVVDPWGLRLNRCNSEPQIVSKVCDTSSVKAVRREITCYTDRVEEAYDSVKWYGENGQHKH
ncbi:MAG: nitrilase-related carbon-nitrogen hydrolase [Candidatus Thorarchaeota archaeon]